MRISSRKNNKIKFNTEHTNYENELGNYVPSVTTILGVLAKSDALMMWANNLGWRHKSYKEELDKSAKIGTTAHAFCEYTFTKDEEILTQIKERMKHFSTELLSPTLNAIESFKKWYIKNKKKIKVIACELKLVCKEFGGTTDLVCKFNGILMLIDFKTSSSYYMSQFLQLAAYAIMYEEMFGEKIEDIAVLKLDKKEGKEAKLLRLSSLPNGDLSYYKHIFKIIVKLYKYHQVLSNDWSFYDSLIKTNVVFNDNDIDSFLNNDDIGNIKDILNIS